MMPTARPSWASSRIATSMAIAGSGKMYAQSGCPGMTMRAATVASTIRPASSTTRRSRYSSGRSKFQMKAASTPISVNDSKRRGGDRPPVELRVAQAERFERLDLERTDDLAVADDGLPARVGLLDGRDRLAGVLLGAHGRVARS